jgi:hypothetical protein
MYAADNSDEMVFCNWDGAGEIVGNTAPTGWLYTHQLVSNGAGTPGPPFPGLYAPASGSYRGNKAVGAYSTGALWDYTKRVGIFWCPLMITNNPSTYYIQNVWKPSAGADALSGYIMNGAVNNYYQMRSTPTFYKLSNISFKPTNFMMWEPDENQPNAFGDGAALPSVSDGGAPSTRHVTGCVLLRIGSSVDFQKYTAITNAMNSPGPNEWWYGPYFTQSGGYPDGQPSHL